MDIYKLGDNIRFETSRDERNSDEEGLIITDIRQAVKNENRVNIFVNGKYSFSLDIAQVVDLGIKKGLIITEEQLADYKKASEFGKAYQRALEWVLTRPHSERELADYLKRRRMQVNAKERKKEWKDKKNGVKPKTRPRYDFDDLIIKRLTERGYVDDYKFAQYYVENRFVKRGVSTKRLEMELMKKGVARDIIERVLNNSERNDEEEIKKIVAKKRARYSDEKLIQYLCRQGFQYDVVKNVVEEFANES